VVNADREVDVRWASLAALGLAVVSVLSCWAAWADIGELAYKDPEQSHVVLALPVALWLAWLRRGRVKYLRPRPSMLGAAVLLLSGLASAAGFLLAIEVVWHGGAIGMLVGSVLTAFGPRYLRAFQPSILVLVFLMPVPGAIRQEIAMPLQQATAHIAEAVFTVVGVPAERRGSTLSIDGIDVTVAEACNGMRMVSALALVAFAFVFSTPMTTRIRILILALSPLVALLVNVARVIPTVLMYGYAEEGSADLFHDLSGWLGLGLALLLFWMFMALLKWLEIPILPYAVRDTKAVAS